MTDTPERELIEHDHVAEACERLRDRDWPSFTPDQIVHVRIGDIRALLSRVNKLEEALRVIEKLRLSGMETAAQRIARATLNRSAS
jgi:hypothetical protein